MAELRRPFPAPCRRRTDDTGGSGVAYHVNSVNGSANSYRSDGVDLETTTDTGGGYDMGWTASGQWFKYTVNVASAGSYTVNFRVAAPSSVTDGFHLSNSSGTNLSGNINVAGTGGWQDWTTVSATVTLPAGVQTLTLNQDNGGWNINWFSFTSGGGTGSCSVFRRSPSVGEPTCRNGARNSTAARVLLTPRCGTSTWGTTAAGATGKWKSIAGSGISE